MAGKNVEILHDDGFFHIEADGKTVILKTPDGFVEVSPEHVKADIPAKELEHARPLMIKLIKSDHELHKKINALVTVIRHLDVEAKHLSPKPERVVINYDIEKITGEAYGVKGRKKYPLVGRAVLLDAGKNIILYIQDEKLHDFKIYPKTILKRWENRLLVLSNYWPATTLKRGTHRFGKAKTPNMVENVLIGITPKDNIVVIGKNAQKYLDPHRIMKSIDREMSKQVVYHYFFHAEDGERKTEYTIRFGYDELTKEHVKWLFKVEMNGRDIVSVYPERDREEILDLLRTIGV